MATPTNMSVAPNMTPAPNMSVGTAAPVAPKPAPIVSGPAVVTSKPAITNVQKQTTDINQKSAAVNAQGLTAQQMGKFAGMTGSQGAAANTGGVTSSSIAAPAGAKLGGDGTLVSFDGGNTWTKNPALAAPSATPTQPTATPTAPSAGVTADKVPLNESRTGYAAGWTQTGTDANGNALFSPPATTPSAAAGGAGTTGTTATGAPADAGAAFAASIAASDARMQAAYDDHKAKIDQIMNGTYPLTDSEKSQLNNISQTFESLIAEQRQANVAYEQSVRVAGITAGRSMYAPEVELGNVKSAIDEGFRKISDLNVKMVTALETAKQAIKDNDVKMLDKMYQDLTSLETSKRASINDLYRISMDSLKEARDVAADKRADAQFEFQKEQAKQAPINAADARVQAAILDYATKYPDAGITAADTLASAAEKGKGSSIFKEEAGGKTKSTVLALVAKYPDAGITASDTLESASNKIKESPSYKADIAKGDADLAKTLADAAKASRSTADQKIVKIGGQDFLQTTNDDGTVSYSQPKVPEISAQLSDIKQNALKSASGLLDKLTAGKGTSAVGMSRIFQWQKIPGTDARDFEAQFDNLKALLSLDNVNLLKGQGAVSDAERKLLADSSTKLSLSQSEGEFQKTLEDIKKTLSTAKIPTPTLTGDISSSEMDELRKAFPNMSDDEIRKQAGNPAPTSSGSATSKPSAMRTDRHNNPTAFTTDIAKVAGLKEGVDYVPGDSFSGGKYKTAKLLNDPVDTTIKVIDKIGFYTGSGAQRWTHTAMPKSEWDSLNQDQKRAVIGRMYQHEGGTSLKNLFA